jgi:hypothetical protein
MIRLLILVAGLMYLDYEAEYGSFGEGEEPQHLSWELGTPDNIPETEVIIDPYVVTPEPDSDESDW